MKIFKNLFFALFLVLIVGYLHSETHEWLINYSLQKYSNFTGIAKSDSMNIMAGANWNTYPSLRQIIKSTNGGITWKMVYSFNDNNLGWFEIKSISYPTKNFCIATCDSNYFLKSTNGGDSWEEHRIDMANSLNGIMYSHMIDSLYGVIGTYQNIVYSKDGFETYKILNLPRTLWIRDIKLVSNKKLYVLTSLPISFFEYNIDEDVWNEYPDPFPNYDPEYNIPYNMLFQDSLTGYIVGLRSTGFASSKYDMIHKTTDGGKTWIEKLNTLNERMLGLFYVDFCDRENGIAVGQAGKIYWTHDAGETWSQDSSKEIKKAQSAVLHVAMLNASTALIADFSGNMWRTPIGTDVPDVLNDDESMIYPNPVRDYLSINISEIEKVEIYSVIGIKLLESEYKDKIDVSGLAPGMYFVRIGDRVGKFVKM